MNLCYVAVYFNLKIYHSPINKYLTQICLSSSHFLCCDSHIFYIIQNIVILYASLNLLPLSSKSMLHCPSWCYRSWTWKHFFFASWLNITLCSRGTEGALQQGARNRLIFLVWLGLFLLFPVAVLPAANGIKSNGS